MSKSKKKEIKYLRKIIKKLIKSDPIFHIVRKSFVVGDPKLETKTELATDECPCFPPLDMEFQINILRRAVSSGLTFESTDEEFETFISEVGCEIVPPRGTHTLNITTNSLDIVPPKGTTPPSLIP